MHLYISSVLRVGLYVKKAGILRVGFDKFKATKPMDGVKPPAVLLKRGKLAFDFFKSPYRLPKMLFHTSTAFRYFIMH